MATDDDINDEREGDELDAPERKSKSQRKREVEAVAALAQRLVDLPANVLAKVPLSEDFAEELQMARRQTARTARQRQIRLLGKLLRDEDIEAIAAVLGRLTGDSPLSDKDLAAHLQAKREEAGAGEVASDDALPLAPLEPTRDLLTGPAEAWRQRLLREGDEALKELLDRYPNADRAYLRQLMRAARAKPNGGAGGKLGSALRALLDADL